ncbi:MAG TPA: hypothetical protein VGE27_03690, partial [Gemmatimonas sp.]
VHVVAALVVVQVLTLGYGIPSWMPFGDNGANREERLTYVETPPDKPSTTVAETPVPARTTTPAPVAPVAAPPAPAGGPPVPAIPAAPRDTGRGAPPGNGIGAIDPNVRGIKPGYEDERVWRGFGGGGGGGSGAGNGVRGDRADGLDSIMAGAISAARDSLDSLARAQGRYGRAPGDWTKTDKNGDKWGWDQKGIRLGKVMIPNALLSLLPLNSATAANMSGNMSRMDADRRLAASREDIQRMSERTMGESEFRRVVREMDKRRDSERRERLRAPSASIAAPVKTPEKSSDR